MFWNFILICAIIGIVSALISKVWDGAQGFISKVLSFCIPGLGAGLFLCTIMFLGTMIGWFNDMYIFGIHPFWIGFIPLTVREIYLSLKAWFMKR